MWKHVCACVRVSYLFTSFLSYVTMGSVNVVQRSPELARKQIQAAGNVSHCSHHLTTVSLSRKNNATDRYSISLGGGGWREVKHVTVFWINSSRFTSSLIGQFLDTNTPEVVFSSFIASNILFSRWIHPTGAQTKVVPTGLTHHPVCIWQQPAAWTHSQNPVGRTLRNDPLQKSTREAGNDSDSAKRFMTAR